MKMQMKDKVFVNLFFHNEDFVNVKESVKAIEREINVLDKYKIKGDLWFTGLTAENILKRNSSIIEKIKINDVVIGYHGDLHCPFPTPIKRISGLDWDRSISEIEKWETSKLDPISGNLDLSNEGGLKIVKSIFGKNPIISAAPVLGGAPACFVHKNLGVKMIISPPGYKDEHSVYWFMGMLTYPKSKDFWGAVHIKYKHGGLPKDPNPFLSKTANLLDYFKYITSFKRGKPFNFISIPMHDYDFYCPHGWTEYDSCVIPQSWAQCYGMREVNPPKLYKPVILSDKEQNEILKEFESLIKLCANDNSIQIVTAEDLCNMICSKKTNMVLTNKRIDQAVTLLLENWEQSPPKYISLDSRYFLSLCDIFQGIVFSLKYYIEHKKLPSRVGIKDILGPTDVPYHLGFPSFRPAKQVDWLPPTNLTSYKIGERIIRPPRLVKLNKLLDVIRNIQINNKVQGIIKFDDIGNINSAEFLYLAAQAYNKLSNGSNSNELFFEECYVVPQDVLENYFIACLDSTQKWYVQLQSWTMKPALFK